MKLLHVMSGVALAVLVAGPALAQTPPPADDPIGALLDSVPPPPEAAPVVTAPEATPQTTPPPAAETYAPRPQALPSPPPQPFWRPKAPVHVEETGKTPDSPPTASDRNYESRLRASFAAAEGMQGPLDGHWVIRAGGTELFDLQLVDKGQGNLEGAWRDPRRRGASDASGFVAEIQRSGLDLTARFQSRPGVDPVQFSLHALPDGSWSGVLVERGDRQEVTMKRN